MKEGRIRTPLAVKVYAIVLISVFLCTVFMGLYNYYETRRALRENIGMGLKKTAQTAALGIDADKLYGIKSSTDPYYREVSRFLRDVKVYNDIKSPIYVLKKKGKNKSSLLVTTEPSFLLGAEYRLNPTMRKVFNTARSDVSPIYKDKNGTWISAYAPIKDVDGNTVGILELNHHIGYYIKQLRFRLLGIIALCLIACLLGVFVVIPLLEPILSNINSLSAAATEMQKGNYNYRIKPRSYDEVGQLAIALEKMRLSLKRYIRQLKEAWIKEREAHLESIKTLSGAIAVRESYTKGHIERVARCAELIAKEMGLTEGEIDIIRYGCVLHDVGKIGVNVDIINKPSKLTDEEYDKIKEHPSMGVKIIEGVGFLEKARDIILHHQERYDGKGYPDGLKGENIPVTARIVCLADAYDAMASDRPYRDRLENNKIIAIIKKESGRQFDPKVVDAFLKVRHEVEKLNVRGTK